MLCHSARIVLGKLEIKISMAVRIERIKNYPYFNLYDG